MSNQTQIKNTDSTDAMTDSDSSAGPLGRILQFGRSVIIGCVIYAVSMIVLFALQGVIISLTSSAAFTSIFAVWMLGTLALIGLLLG